MRHLLELASCFETAPAEPPQHEGEDHGPSPDRPVFTSPACFALRRKTAMYRRKLREENGTA
jgi:hypothetical protein